MVELKEVKKMAHKLVQDICDDYEDGTLGVSICIEKFLEDNEVPENHPMVEFLDQAIQVYYKVEGL